MSGANRHIRSQPERGRSATGTPNGEDEDSSSPDRMVVEDKSTPPLETPRVLTRGVISSLTHGLDASDVLECYALMRSAPLHGIANSTITIQKRTIGIRFRPKAADLKNPFNFKTHMELTLEYGPARLGPLLSDEATPIVQGNDDSSSYLTWDNTGKVYFTQKIVTENYLSSHYMASMTGAVLNKLLTEAVEYTEKRKVYQPFAVYSDNDKMMLRSSSSSDFTWFVWSHLAKLGVEIEPILPPAMYETRLYTKSVEKVFPDQSVTRAAATVYQRFYRCLESIATNNYGSFLSSRERSTVNNDDDDSTSASSSGATSQRAKNGGNRGLGSGSASSKNLKSSRTDNINYEKRRKLEDEGTATEAPEDVTETAAPTYFPTVTYRPTSSENDMSEEMTESEAAEDLTDKTAPIIVEDEISEELAETEAPEDSTEKLSPTFVEDEMSEEATEPESPEDLTETIAPTFVEDEMSEEALEPEVPENEEEIEIAKDEVKIMEIEVLEEEVFPEDQEGENILEEDDLVVKNSISHDELTEAPDLGEEDDSVLEAEAIESPTVELVDEQSSETLSPTEGIQDVEKAQNAANDAQKAADEAKIAAHTEGETKAADAAQAAADAALVAADATSSAASQAAMDSLLSGDGTMMSSIVSTCFSNPRYQIASPDSNRTASTEIYLFKDPSTYYKLELTSPYIEVVKLNRPLPIAVNLLSDNGAGGDALDWTLAMGIFFSMFLMVLLICQQMGNRYVDSIFNCQRWFFNPRDCDNEEELNTGVHSGSHFFFGKSGIPVSMGGMQSSYSPLNNETNLQTVIVNESMTDDEVEHEQNPLSPNLSKAGQELEMVTFGSPDDHNLLGLPDHSESSVGSSEDDEIRLEIPDRLLRNPDMVELPSLKSKSKVAIPVGRQNSNGHYSRSSSLGDGSNTSSPTKNIDLAIF